MNCSVWYTSDEPPPPEFKARWNGPCDQGFAQGFGIQESTYKDGSQIYTGHMNQGKWHGLGRVFHRDADKKLIAMTEVAFINDQMQGIATTVLNRQNPLNKETLDVLLQENVGVSLGDKHLRFMEYYQDDEALSACNFPTMCVVGAKKERSTLTPVTDGGTGMNMPMSVGGWKIQVKSMRQKAGQTPVEEAEQSISYCMLPSEMHSPARTGDVLFPSLSNWTVYLSANYECKDTLLVWDGKAMSAKSVCTSAATPELVEIGQQRIANGTRFAIVLEETAKLDGKITDQSVKSIVGIHQPQCEANALPVANLKF
ncbi:MAG: hypothetical protein KAY21_11785 [Limnohabitans sp.]|nr:hypothetical protein [Limnohabitans sp.]